MDETGSGSYLMTKFDISGVERSDYTTRELAKS